MEGWIQLIWTDLLPQAGGNGEAHAKHCANVFGTQDKKIVKISTAHPGGGYRPRVPRLEDKLDSVKSRVPAAFTYGVVQSTA